MPAGWQVIRIGRPGPGEYWLDYGVYQDGIIVVEPYEIFPVHYLPPLAIVTRLAHWQQLWHQQWKGTPLEGRVRSHVDDPWEYSTIIQYRPGIMKWQTANGRWYKFAQVRSMDIPK